MLKRLITFQQRHSGAFIASSLVVLLISVCYFLMLRSSGNRLLPQTKLRIASQQAGTYQQVLSHLVEYINAHPDNMDFRIVTEPIDSEGSLKTIEQIQANQVDIALIQGNTIVESPDVRACLQLYAEVYYFFSYHQGTSLEDICRRIRNKGEFVRVASLGPGSQTYHDLLAVLGFYGITRTDILHANLRYEESAAALKSKKVDIAFFVAGSQNAVVRSLAKSQGITLCPVTRRTALLENMCGVAPHQITDGSLGDGAPASTVNTIMTPATLVVNRRLNTSVVQELTAYLLRKKGNLKRSMPQIEVSEVSAQSDIPLHKGAERAIRGDLFWVLERYEVLGKFVSFLFGALLSSATLAFTVWKHLHDERQRRQGEPRRHKAAGSHAPEGASGTRGRKRKKGGKRES